MYRWLFSTKEIMLSLENTFLKCRVVNDNNIRVLLFTTITDCEWENNGKWNGEMGLLKKWKK